MAAGGHFGLPKLTFYRISHHFRSIHNFFFTKWLPAAILDYRNSLSIAFLTISDQTQHYFFFNLFHKMAAGVHLGWSKITLDRIFSPFQINTQLLYFFKTFFFLIFFYKITSGGHFGWPKITFDRIYRHFRWIHNFVFLIFFTKWLPAAILDYRNSLSIAFLTISDQNATFFVFTKWPPASILNDRKSLWIAFFLHFRSIRNFYFFGWSKITFDSISRHFRPIWTILGWPKITFGRISRHFRSIRNFFVNLFSRWPPTAAQPKT